MTDIRTSPDVGKLAPALVAAQLAADAPRKTSQNPHFKSAYAGLPEVRAALLPHLLENGIAVIQAPAFENGAAVVRTRLQHTSGEWLEFDSGAPIGKMDAQGWRGAITYIRRTVLEGVGALAAEDDDGHSASNPKKAHAVPFQTAAEAARVITAAVGIKPTPAPSGGASTKAESLSEKNKKLLYAKAGGDVQFVLDTVARITGKPCTEADWPKMNVDQYHGIVNAIEQRLPESVSDADRVDELVKVLEAKLKDNAIPAKIRVEVQALYNEHLSDLTALFMENLLKRFPDVATTA